MDRPSRRIVVALVMGLFFLSSCGGTKLINPWMDSAYKGRYLKNVLVVGMSDLLDRRTLFEDTFARNFQEQGVNTVSLASLAPKKEATREDAKAEAVKAGMDAIFAIRLVSISEKEFLARVVPPPETSGLDMGYSVLSLAPPETDYVKDKKLIVMESTLYDTATEKIIWRTRTETIDPQSIGDLTDAISRAVMKNLRANKLIR
jgi:hypothetical protein